jgi:hypothetical protein
VFCKFNSIFQLSQKKIIAYGLLFSYFSGRVQSLYNCNYIIDRENEIVSRYPPALAAELIQNPKEKIQKTKDNYLIQNPKEKIQNLYSERELTNYKKFFSFIIFHLFHLFQ